MKLGLRIMKFSLKILFIILLFSFSLISMTYALNNQMETEDTKLNNQITINGNEDFLSIQNAIDNASDGDTIFVPSGIYHEPLIIDKQLNLIGESAYTTIIDVNGYLWNPVFIKSSNVVFKGFTVKNSTFNDYAAGIYIQLTDWNETNPTHTIRNITVKDCIIKHTPAGVQSSNATKLSIINCSINNNMGNSILCYASNDILIDNCEIYNNGMREENCWISGCIALGAEFKDRDNATISNCTITNNDDGIYACEYSNLTIKDNYIANNDVYGIKIRDFNNWWISSTISNNIIKGSDTGIHIDEIVRESHRNQTGNKPADEVIITHNIIQNNKRGFVIHDDNIDAEVHKNNFISNFIHANFHLYLPLKQCLIPPWNNNYWDNSIGSGPKIIYGAFHEFGSFMFIPWLTFDLYPSPEPFDILTDEYQ